MGKLLKAGILATVLLAVALYILISTFAPGDTPREQAANARDITKAELKKAGEMFSELAPKAAPEDEGTGIELLLEGPGAKPGPAASPAPSAGPVQHAEPTENAGTMEVVRPAAPPAPPAPVIHVVVEGDTLSNISDQYYGTSKKWKSIQEANGGVKPEELRVGMKLAIPQIEGPGIAPPVVPDGPAEPAPAKEYVVQPGDTLYNIATRFLGDGNRYREIEQANPGLKAESLSVGRKIHIPTGGGRG